jgi:LytR cell envelope-related transcriptional attenuator
VEPRELTLREVRESPWLQQRELAARLSAETGLAESTLIRLFRRMEAEGELRPGLDGRRRTYALPEPKPESPPPAPAAPPSAGALWSNRLAPLGEPEPEPADHEPEPETEPAAGTTRARWPILAIVAVVLGVSVLAAVLLSPTKRDPFTGQPEDQESQPVKASSTPRPPAPKPEAKPKQQPKAAATPKVKVAVLSGVATPGAAAKEAKRLKAKGLRIGAVTNAPRPADRSAVLYARGEVSSARAVAEEAGIRSVKAADSASSDAAGGAKVAVVVGSAR